jgi:hypothetical protein
MWRSSTSHSSTCRKNPADLPAQSRQDGLIWFIWFVLFIWLV